MSDGRMEFERELVERLTDIAPRPRRDALERAKLAVAHTTQRRGWHVQLTGALVGLDWSSVGATAAIATVALVLGIAIGRLGLPAAQGPSTAPSPSGASSPCVEPTPSAAGSLPPEALAWTSERQTQDWPGPLRVEPPGCVPILVPASTPPGEMGGYSYHDRIGDVGEAFALVDIVDLEFGEHCWFAPSGCVYFDMAADVPEPMPDPADQWIAYGIVVDTTGDGRPEFRYGIDNAAPDADGGRMWRIDLTTGSTYISPLGLLEDPQVMDAVFPSDRDLGLAAGFNPGSVYAKRLRDQPVFRFYVWASVIVDGQIVATDYAPDAGWIELSLPQADE